MGFCRRCGEIVVGPKCKCGGTPVAPVVPWNQLNPKEQTQDRWSKTYVSKDSSKPLQNNNNNHTPSSPTKRFPRPLSSTATNANPSHSQLNSRVSAHIASTTSRPPSPLKSSTTYSADPIPESDILPSLDTSSLSKVYGSVLQPKESLATHSCVICTAPFLPDATIYPDPNAPSDGTRFLCRPCFISNGGSKGACAACDKPVLTLKAEGGFISAAGNLWHKRCFRCEGCFKNIGDKPMVDLLGKPSCVDCFDSCLKRDGNTPQKRRDSHRGNDSGNNLGGLQGGKSREGSPTLDELEQRLGITKRRESIQPTDARCDDSAREASPLRTPLSGRHSVRGESPSPLKKIEGLKISSPGRKATASPSGNASPKPVGDVIDGIKKRHLGQSSSPVRLSPSRTSFSPVPENSTSPSNTVASSAPPRASFSPRRLSRSISDKERDVFSATPDLVSDLSDTTTQSSGPDSPADVFGDGERTIRGRGRGVASSTDHGRVRVSTDFFEGGLPAVKPRARSHTTTVADLSPTATCGKCHRTIFGVLANSTRGQFVTIPDKDGESKTYHTDCFRCVVCDKAFDDDGKGKAVFVRTEEGSCHVECAPSPKKYSIGRPPAITTVATTAPPPPATFSRTSTDTSSSRYSGPGPQPQPPLTAPPATTSSQSSFPRFGSTLACPGCRKSVSPMERGVVPGPQGTRWHVGCLVCGGKKDKKVEKKDGTPGCGKKLDSAAKGDGEGGIWCRECLLLPPVVGSSTRFSHITPSYTGTCSAATTTTAGNGVFPKVTPQFTGTTTLARQFTGLGGGDTTPLIMRQMTGGGGGQMSPTRQLALDRSGSPTKGMGTGMAFERYRSGSPVKQLGTIKEGGGIGSGRERPRPKSVIGMRGKGVDERRGMFLVRQMTGGGWV